MINNHDFDKWYKDCKERFKLGRAEILEEHLMHKITPEEFIDNCEIFVANKKKKHYGH